MKNKIAVLTVLTLIGICGFFGFAYLKYANASSDIGFEVKSAKTEYTVGQVVPVSLVIRNNRAETLALPGNLVEYLSLQVSEAGSEYKTYQGVGSGVQIDGLFADMKLHAGKTLTMPTSIFWNAKPETTNLSPMAIQKLTKGKIDTDYVFSKPGTYLIRATLNIPGENPLKLETAPLKIIITEAEGEDLAVWNAIKERPEIGYFIQTGDFKTRDPEARENLRREVEEIAYLHQTSTIAKQIERSLERLQINEAKKKAARENLKQQPE